MWLVPCYIVLWVLINSGMKIRKLLLHLYSTAFIQFNGHTISEHTLTLKKDDFMCANGQRSIHLRLVLRYSEISGIEQEKHHRR